MYISQVPQDRPQDEIGQAVAQEVVVKAIPEQPLDPYCLCDLGIKECDYRELAFYGGTNQYENDYTSLFVNKVDSSDVIEFYLKDVEDATFSILLESSNASSYGEYSEDSNHQGVKIDFDTLKANFPNLQIVKFQIRQEVFGTPLETETNEFVLTPFSLENAEGTVRIETINNGRIESGNDYEKLEWKRATRIRGFFGRESPTIVVDNYQDGERTIKQIQDRIENEYTLETELIPHSIFRMLMFNDMLSNRILISDYNLRNVNYKGVEVSPVSITSNYYEKNSKGSYEITFTDRVQNNVKRNV